MTSEPYKPVNLDDVRRELATLQLAWLRLRTLEACLRKDSHMADKALFYPLTSPSPLAQSIRTALQDVPPGHGKAVLFAEFEDGTLGAQMVVAHRLDETWAISAVVGWDEVKKFGARVQLDGSW